MTSLQELLGGMGMSPATMSSAPGRQSDYIAQSPLAMAEQERRKRALAALIQPGVTGGVPGAGVSGGNNPLAQFNGLGSVSPRVSDGFQLSDIGGALKDGVGALLSAVDTGRAYVASGAKELTDAFAASGVGRWLGTEGPDWLITQRTNAEYDQHLKDIGAWGGWENKDFASQGAAHKGMGDYFTQINPNRSLTYRRVMGFMGDVGADPLTHVALGGETIAKGGQAVEKGIMEAANQGGRQEIAQAISKQALQHGLADDSAIQALVRDAANRGRGALTKRGLARAGVDAAMAEKLGLPQLERQFLGVSIKGSGAVTNIIEDTKGVIKEAIGTSGAAKFGRAIRISDKYGQKRLMDMVRGGATSKGQAALAVRLLGINGEAKAAGSGWGNAIAQIMKNDLKDGMRGLNSGDAINFTHELEQGLHAAATSELGSSTRKIFDKVLADLKDAGVDIGELDADGLKYVPHMSTRAARMSDHPDIQALIVDRDLGDRRAFQQARTLKKGMPFLGETLESGSIKEINEKSERLLGFKVFEDDIREILPRYVAQAQEAMVDQGIRNGMVAQGIATEQRLKMMMTEGEKAAYEEAKKAEKAAWDAQTVQLSDGTKVRYDGIKDARGVLKAERKSLESELETLRVSKITADRNRTMWTNRVSVLKQEVPHLQEAIAFYKRQAGRLRGMERDAAYSRLRRAEAALEVKAKELEVLNGRLDNLPPVTGNVEDWAAQTGVADTLAARDALDPKVAALEERVAKNTADHEALLQVNTPLGDRPDVAYEQAIVDQQRNLDWAHTQVGRDEASIMDSRWQDVSYDDKIKVAETKLAEVTKALEAAKRASKMVKPTSKNAIGAADHAVLRDEFQNIIDVMKVIAPSDNPALKKMMEAQLDGALADMAAIRAGRKATTASDLVRAMESPKFGSVMDWTVEHGMHGIGTFDGTAMQVPGWMGDIYKTQAMIKDPKHFVKFADTFNWFQNQWKAYATMRPGFVTRNAYSSTYSFYLEAGDAAAVKSALGDFGKFYRMYTKNPENYMELATQRFGAETAGRLDEALKVVAATGGGLAPSEVASNVFKKGTWNPLSSEFKGIRATRGANESVEATIRGAHAYDVMRRGGDLNTALATVEKYHFNYKDITDFDRAVKKVIPFWMFYSNNVALQAHVFTHDLAAFNRSFVNLRRQMELGQPGEKDKPDYMNGLNMMPINVNPEGKSRYAPVDVGPTQFLNTLGLVGDPKKMVSDLGLSPLAGLPLQAVAGENLFTGAPNDRLRPADPISNVMMPWLQEGGTTGNGVYSQFSKDAIQGLLPGLATGMRGTDKFANDQGLDFLSGFLGFPQQTWAPEQRKGVRYGAKRDAKAAQAKRALLAKM